MPDRTGWTSESSATRSVGSHAPPENQRSLEDCPTPTLLEAEPPRVSAPRRVLERGFFCSGSSPRIPVESQRPMTRDHRSGPRSKASFACGGRFGFARRTTTRGCQSRRLHRESNVRWRNERRLANPPAHDRPTYQPEIHPDDSAAMEKAESGPHRNIVHLDSTP